ncbi:hypothetical protein Plhal703r1_c30g0118631 [Plasmopara halstedii]
MMSKAAHPAIFRAKRLLFLSVHETTALEDILPESCAIIAQNIWAAFQFEKATPYLNPILALPCLFWWTTETKASRTNSYRRNQVRAGVLQTAEERAKLGQCPRRRDRDGRNGSGEIEFQALLKVAGRGKS